ncbi:hypothetical protein [Saccharopolyspora gloriosae]|uniref:Rv2732c family membrane protein n=1 Tax=Saccharopolyspora gloriosae TaxID=455344 RepID=UPI001FB81BC4|nr:hypothetical protein [Saccharopolyspora gloriosae]
MSDDDRRSRPDPEEPADAPETGSQEGTHVQRAESSDPANGTDQDRADRRQLSKAERDLLRRIDPGSTAVTIAAVILVLIVSSLLPWIGDATGLQILLGQADPSLDVGLLPRLFALNATIVGVLIGALALTTRRWAIAWVAGMAAIIVSFEGMIAIWSRQTVPTGGPSWGLVLAALCMVVLAVQWLRVVLTRP